MLSRQLIQAFANKQIVCVEYDDLTDDQEREIFQVSILLDKSLHTSKLMPSHQRVQLGVALTTAGTRSCGISGAPKFPP